MGLRSLERRLATEVCYDIVAGRVDEYLRQSEEAGHLLNPVSNLEHPILRAGFHPPGLHQAALDLARQRRPRKHLEIESDPPGPDQDQPLRFPDANELIKDIFDPYPMGDLNAHRARQARAYAASPDRHRYT